MEMLTTDPLLEERRDTLLSRKAELREKVKETNKI